MFYSTPAFSRDISSFFVLLQRLLVFREKLVKSKEHENKNSPIKKIPSKYAVACLRSCFIFTSFGTFCVCVEAPVRSTSSFKLTQPSNIEVGTYVYFT